MMSISIEEAIARVPQWAGARNIEVAPLAGGITNRNYRVNVNDESFVLRISGQNAELLGINREHEYAAHSAAAALGIASEVFYFIRPEGYLVTRFLHARPLPPEEIKSPDNIRRVATALRRVHAMPPIPGRFSPFRTIESYAETARRGGVSPPKDFEWLDQRMREAEASVREINSTSQPCHNDLLNENFLDDGRIRILDWEYAGMGDMFFDLANFAVNHNFEEEQDRFLLECYFGAVTAAHLARLKLMKLISDFREGMWGVVQMCASELDFDFQAYARNHFDRAMRSFDGPLWERWLKEVQDYA